jgi:hypothetical protein
MKPNLLLLAALAALAASLQSGAQTVAQPTWRASEKRDPADTYSFTRFTLTGGFAAAAAQSAERPAITVDCIAPSAGHRAKFLAGSLLVGKPMEITFVEPAEIRGTSYYPKIAVRYRADGAEAREGNWPQGTDRTPVPNPADKTAASIPSEALRRILTAHKVAITVPDANGAPLEMQFDMPDPKPVEAACNLGS